MKNVVKKSKFVILPALATLVLTGVASVTGTVAWFTANRAVTASVSSFQAHNLNGNFTIKATGVENLTEANDSDNSTSSAVIVDSSALLADASVDVLNNKLYTKVLSDNGILSGYKEIGSSATGATASSPNLAGKVKVGDDTKNVFYAITWSYTFTYQIVDQSKKIDLFLDTKSAKFSYTPDSTKTNDAAKAFRIGFIGSTNSGAKIVLANNDVKTYVNQTTNTATATYDKNIIQAGNYGKELGSLATDIVSIGDNTSRADYIGTFTPAKNGNTISVNCVAWFEGTDTTNVSNEAALSAVSANFGFYVRDGGTYTAPTNPEGN